MPSELRVFLLPEAIINPLPTQTDGEDRFKVAGVGAALLEVFAPKVIEVAIGATAKLLKDAGEAKTLQASGSAPTHLFVADAQQALRLNDRLGAIIAVYGDFAVKGDSDPDVDAVELLKRRKLIPKDSAIELIIELELISSEDRTACYLRTTHCSLNGFFGKDKGERGLSVTVSLATPSSTVEGEVFAIGAVDLGTVTLPSNLLPRGDNAAREIYRSNWLPFAQISNASKALYDADVMANRAKGHRYMPVTVAVTVSQTEDGHPFLLKLGELLEGAKAETVAAIKRAIIPSERDKAADERFAAETKLYEDELAAEGELEKAQEAFDAGSEKERPALKRKLELATRKRDWARQRRRAAGLPDL